MNMMGLAVEQTVPDQLDYDISYELPSNADVGGDGVELDVGVATTTGQDNAVVENEHAIDLDASSSAIDDGQRDAEPQPKSNPSETEVSQEDVYLTVSQDYQDEIGYEEEYVEVADVHLDVVSTDAAVADAASLEDHVQAAQPTQEFDGGRNEDHHQSYDEDHEEYYEEKEEHYELADEESCQENQAAGETRNPEDHDEIAEAQEHSDDTEKENAGACPDDDDEPAGVHEKRHYSIDDIDKAMEDLAESIAELPDIEVIYNDACYSLFGHPDDDPETYFLSDPKELDLPLSEFLAALRTVISNEISVTDEVVIGFEPLGLEFGERSNEKFLQRTFREILDCHRALVSKDPSISSEPVIYLMVRRDSEEHFVELLADAGLLEYSDQDSSMSPEEAVTAELSAVEQSEQESPESEYPEERDETHCQATAGNDRTDMRHMKTHDESKVPAAPAKETEAHEADYKIHDYVEAPEAPTKPAKDSYETETAAGDEQEYLEEQYPEHGGEEECEEREEYEEHEEHEGQDPEEIVGNEDRQAHEWHEEVKGEAEHNMPPHDDTALSTDHEQQQPPEMETAHEEADDAHDRYAELEAADHNAVHDELGQYDQQLGPNGKEDPAFLDPLSDLDGDWDTDYADDCTDIPSSPSQEDKVGQNVTASVQTGVADRKPELPLIETDVDSSEPHHYFLPNMVFNNQPWPAQRPVGRLSYLRLASRRSHSRCDSLESGSSVLSNMSEISMALSRDTDANRSAFEADDIELAVDEEPMLSVIQEEYEHEQHSSVYEAAVNAENYQQNTARHHPFDQHGEQPAAAMEDISVSTSTTLDDDQIGYEDEAAEESRKPEEDASAHQLADDNDEEPHGEIDWENDSEEDEDEEEQVEGTDEAVGYDAKGVDLTPGSFAGKRQRANEEEGLADETGMPASPPLKRARQY
ncbi:uncharacterized protein CTHT_0026340 [Thermochaetoides thermophila DSM 1495]|uniref:Uncharacterized protein n=1 Tax=Chaetomium thermophilum (strain DSM 1495 / CBS 144.50 / IMI 039719) TaxID=759272 RepID=G0S6I5_CHATD|nr:hypothetical protein CTHT_0026340 [Thermochaetoides thermophila DSM 1495]EGS20796.1 hypothetical protein CTHT_0026340 [Thermochaetoides thermophila DSM 1495]